jgi:thioredoxin reductase (NADPH)
MYDLIIIGAGPAGLTAGIYAGRFRLSTLILEKMSVGGQIITSADIENFPGFPGGIATLELIDKFKEQVDALGLKIEMDEAIEIAPDKNNYLLKTAGNSYQARAVIIASGAQPKKLAVAGEERLTGRGVSYCGTCDAPLFKDKEVIAIGAGDRAIEEAIFLARYAAKVSVVHRRNSLRASRILEEKARQNPKINFILESTIEEIIGENRVEKVKIRNLKTGAISDLSCQGVFVFVGIRPNTDFLKNILHLDESGFIITGQDLAASRKGVFACGDCLKKNLYQVVNACAEGALAAHSANIYLLEQ